MSVWSVLIAVACLVVGLPPDMPSPMPDVPPEFEPMTLDRTVHFPKVSIGGVRSDAVADAEQVIYSNTLGIRTVNFPANQPVSDDIATIAADGCHLTRYRFKVLGRVFSLGKCVGGANANAPCQRSSDCASATCSTPDPGTPYTVTYGLYANCPLAVGTTTAQRDLVKIPFLILYVAPAVNSLQVTALVSRAAAMRRSKRLASSHRRLVR